MLYLFLPCYYTEATAVTPTQLPTPVPSHAKIDASPLYLSYLPRQNYLKRASSLHQFILFSSFCKHATALLQQDAASSPLLVPTPPFSQAK
jgi:hypothetical protein